MNRFNKRLGSRFGKVKKHRQQIEQVKEQKEVEIVIAEVKSVNKVVKDQKLNAIDAKFHKPK